MLTIEFYYALSIISSIRNNFAFIFLVTVRHFPFQLCVLCLFWISSSIVIQITTTNFFLQSFEIVKLNWCYMQFKWSYWRLDFRNCDGNFRYNFYFEIISSPAIDFVRHCTEYWHEYWHWVLAWVVNATPFRSYFFIEILQFIRNLLAPQKELKTSDIVSNNNSKYMYLLPILLYHIKRKRDEKDLCLPLYLLTSMSVY